MGKHINKELRKEGKKRCNQCKRILLLSEFGKNKAQKDGLSSQCKKCKNENRHIYRLKYPQKNREYIKKWKLKNPELRKNQMKRYRIKNHVKISIESDTNYKCEKGTLLMKPYCELCGSSENLQKHHPDYNHPDFFITLCRDNHNFIEKYLRLVNKEKEKFLNVLPQNPPAPLD